MKKIILPLFFLFSFLAVALPVMSQNASAILRESNARFSMLQDFSAEFVFSIENPTRLNSSISKTGMLFYSKGKYVIKMPDQEIYTDRKTLWIHLPEEEELNIMDFDEDEGIAINQIFKFTEGQETKGQYEGQQLIGGRTFDQISFLVSDPNFDFNQAMIWINTESNLMEKIIITNRRQTNTTYEFSNIIINQGLPESTFVFDTSNFKGDIFDEREGN
ncbi:outer membrane lipoprotein carrier protein LolA [Algoriphagus sp. SE2]|uniref:LolA family protein n=1 Tax=Algoriphagus sp. SE2 TaxID=3141536 RepID=UPI0031CD8AD3